jgi:hypothetical protein
MSVKVEKEVNAIIRESETKVEASPGPGTRMFIVIIVARKGTLKEIASSGRRKTKKVAVLQK